MKIHKLIFLSTMLWLHSACNQPEKTIPHLSLIPEPDSIELEGGYSACIAPFYLSGLSEPDSSFKAYLQELHLITNEKKATPLVLNLNPENQSLGKDGYQLEIGKKQVQIEAATQAGLFYGVQTLRQLIDTESRLPVLRIVDQPRFEYRGMHLDVSRHFFSTDFIKKQLDEMAYYKFNRFHWHLTDGAGWRIEIPAYPLLTEVAAWRPYPTWKEWGKGKKDYCTQDTPGAQGGYYTHEQIREIVAYAAQRHIQVIPEIELPSHSEEVLAVYPELSCSGKPYESSDFCVGNEKTFEFLETVFDQVIDLFPSQEIHIGGDEAAKTAWPKCPKCKKRMQDHQLKDVDELQSYMIRRVGKYLTSKGKTFIGWDEILQGGLAENAVVMSWRSEEGAMEAVKKGHRAILTPGGYCYFDAYQKNPATEPEAIGGYLPIQKVYSYNPVPDSLSQAEADLIMGVQANLWTEYISTESHVEYMIYPRLLALSEVAWSEPGNKSWNDFKLKLNKHIDLLKAKDINASPLSSEVLVIQDPDLEKQVMCVSMETDLSPATIYYTLDGSIPTSESTVYQEPIELSGLNQLTTVVFKNGEQVGEPKTTEVNYHKAIGKMVVYQAPYSEQYPAGGTNALVNGLKGGYGYGDGRWQGFLNDMDVIVDLASVIDINRVKAKFMQVIGPWVWMPVDVTVSVSEDGNDYTTVCVDKNSIPVDQEGVIFQEFGFEGKAKARFVRFQAKNYKGFLFTDELIID